MEESQNLFTKRVKHSHKNKSSKSKSKNHFKGPSFNDKSEKASPMPKSPNTHMKSPKSNNLVKVKTSYKLKVSAEKIVTTNNLVGDKIKKKRDPKHEHPG
jgi:hypothetical protein